MVGGRGIHSSPQNKESHRQIEVDGEGCGVFCIEQTKIEHHELNISKTGGYG